MELVNLTPFAAEAFRQMDPSGALYGVIAVRGTFDLVPDGPMALAPEQTPFAWEDVVAETPGGPILLMQSDFIPHKPGTDVTVIAHAHAPDGVPVTRIDCGVRIDGRFEKRITVHGPRQWIPQRRDEGVRRPGKKAQWQWQLGEAAPFLSAPVAWTLAVGGLLPSGDGAVHIDNPAGMGIVGPIADDTPQPVPAPRIELPHEPISDWRHLPAPAGFGPIAPAWQTRLKHAGTYDAAWLAHRHPMPPEDFDLQFWQCAPPDMVVTPYLNGHEGYALANLHEEFRVLFGQLPGCYQRARVHWPDGHQDVTLALDGVHFDVRSGGAAQAVLTWRKAMPLYGHDDLRVVLRTVDGAGRRWGQTEENAA
ncbi:MAG: DUF2169 family type VI secretion system accessory protein [Beijerinckiaceae bacterium]